MSQRNNKAVITACIIATFLLLQAGTSLGLNGNSASKIQKQRINPSAVSNKLPHKQIKRFVTAIAAIKHYYIKKTTDKALFNNAIRGMVSSLDPHSTYLDASDLKELKTAVSGQFVGIGIELTTQGGALKVISPLEGTPAFRAGIKTNDLIVKINGMLVQNMSLRQAIRHIKGKTGSKVHLTIIRKNRKTPLRLTITRDTIKILTVKKKLLQNNYGYIRITFFQGPVEKALRKNIRALQKEAKGHLKGLILDLRNNPGGLLDVSAEVADTFLDSKKIHKYNDLIVYTKGRIKGSDVRFRISAGDMIKGIPMVVLINGGSASASEIVAGALQDYKRAIIMGTRSFGKGSVQTVIPISANSAIKLTTALYHTPSGRVIQAQGIEPNVVVPELKVSEKNTDGLIDFDEADYRNHLKNNTHDKTVEAKLAALKKQRKEEIKLARKDYQLYEALMMLKGLHAVKH